MSRRGVYDDVGLWPIDWQVFLQLHSIIASHVASKFDWSSITILGFKITHGVSSILFT